MIVEYRADYMNKGRADSAFEYLRSPLPWKRRKSTPRMEVFYSEEGCFVADVHKLKLEHGSLMAMSAGFQQTHYRRIPTAGFTCGELISLTYRGALKKE